MSQMIVNLTLSVVIEKINDVLDESPHWNEQSALAYPELQQRLATYVLRRMPVVYVTLASEGVDRRHPFTQGDSYDQHRQIEHLIQQGLQTLLENSARLGSESAQVFADAGGSPSSWFG